MALFLQLLLLQVLLLCHIITMREPFPYNLHELLKNPTQEIGCRKQRA